MSHHVPEETWTLGFHDPSLIGWATTGGYLIALILSLLIVRRVRASSLAPNRGHNLLLWWGIAAILLFLGLNKQLDLQTALIQLGRELAKADGWYENRRSVQAWFAFGFVGAVLCLFVWAGASLRPLWRRNWLVFLGLAFLGLFITARCIGMQHLGEERQGYWIKHGLELAGIACITIAAAFSK